MSRLVPIILVIYARALALTISHDYKTTLRRWDLGDVLESIPKFLGMSHFYPLAPLGLKCAIFGGVSPTPNNQTTDSDTRKYITLSQDTIIVP